MNLKINKLWGNFQISFRKNNHKLLESMNQQSQSKNVPPQDTKEKENRLAEKIIGGVTAFGVALGGILMAIKRKGAIPKEIKHLETGLCKKFPELDIFSNAEKQMFKKIENSILAKIKKATAESKSIGTIEPDKSLFDIDFYKDNFLLEIINPARTLKVFRETKNPKLKALFNNASISNWVSEGMIIYGSNKIEKAKLFNYFLNQAKKYDLDIVNIKATDRKMHEFATEFVNAITKGKEKFLKEQRHTMIVMENVDEILTLPKTGGNPYSALWNKNVLECGKDGVTFLTTAEDITKFNPSSIRKGRITHLINIDTALARQVEADALKT